MKLIINRLLICTFIITLVGCGDFDDLNVNPNEPTDVPAGSLVTQGLYRLPDLYWSRDMNFEYGMLFVQHLAQDEYTEEQRYNFTPADFDNGWNTTFASILSELDQAKTLVEADENVPSEAIRANQIAVIDIMMAFGFQMATDIWGDMPYSQALNPDEFPKPAYDSQSAIYESLISNVTAAVNSINTGAAGFSSDVDIIYGGDMDGWQKFGNALLLRMGMRIADANSSLASSTVSAALNGNIISSVADEASLVYLNVAALSNPFWFDASPNGGSRDDFRITDELLSTLQAMGDPRETLYADSTASGTYVGMPYGLGDNDAFALKATTSRFGAMVRQQNAPAYLLRFSEVKFLEAEAIERGFVTGVALTEFNAGITAAMNEWGITDATTINDYIAANPYDAANWEQSIGLQMWLALYTNGLEAWATWRRLDQPVLSVPAAAVEPSIPVRGLYPTDEAATNQENLLAVPFDDALDTNLWWDVN
ncbi:Starch-binding associating with outer membrane [Ekhidna lutea]|uniref:Starch-binding associating with outer membrane n=1 Tax=Ekhidna lutea TaxID=447679 RepID=A0A239M8A4_EKHLU|nr:SusD/RagB family nutrient-binding outer membrane lipoprotein [Ekhidna lutea]SNT38372.1 Starch-binding associating with outer membrane [Ekhidna lutea]